MSIYDWVLSLSGTWGPAMLAFYERNAGWINIIVVLYGLILLLSWQNMDRVISELTEQIMTQAAQIQSSRKKEAKSKKMSLAEFELSWDKALMKSRFPLIAKQTGIIPCKSSLENIRSLVTKDDLFKRTARKLAALGIDIEK